MTTMARHPSGLCRIVLAAAAAAAGRLRIRGRAYRGSRAERLARYAAGMAPWHPERITPDLPGRQDEQLAELATELWPDDEYTAIITELRGTEGQP